MSGGDSGSDMFYSDDDNNNSIFPSFVTGMMDKIGSVRNSFDDILASLSGKTTDFKPNQIEDGKKIIESMNQNTLTLYINAPQAGKTGALSYVVNQLKSKYDHIYYIINDSSCQLKEQTTKRMPENVKVFHRNDLLSDKQALFHDLLENNKNILLISDEAHLANKTKQTLDRLFKKVLLDNIDNFKTKNIKMILATATPNNLWKSFNDNESSNIVVGQPGDGYNKIYGPSLQQYERLWDEDSEKNKECINKIAYAFVLMKKTYDNDYKYHIFRGPDCRMIDTFKQNISDAIIKLDEEYGIKMDVDNNNIIEDYHSNDQFVDDNQTNHNELNSLLLQKPKKHKIIIIMNKYRQGATLNKEHIGIMYERRPKKNESISYDSVMQGLYGRCLGYEKHNIICFTHKPVVELYWHNFKMLFKTMKGWKMNSKATYLKRILD